MISPDGNQLYVESKSRPEHLFKRQRRFLSHLLFCGLLLFSEIASLPQKTVTHSVDFENTTVLAGLQADSDSADEGAAFMDMGRVVFDENTIFPANPSNDNILPSIAASTEITTYPPLTTTDTITTSLLNLKNPEPLTTLGLSIDWTEYFTKASEIKTITGTFPILGIADSGMNLSLPAFQRILATPQEAGCPAGTRDFVTKYPGEVDPAPDLPNYEGVEHMTGVASWSLRLPPDLYKIFPVQVLDYQNITSFDTVNQALLYLETCKNVRVINLSLGTNCPMGCDLPVKRTIERLIKKGVIIVAGAGNRRLNQEVLNSYFVPAHWPGVVGVAGIEADGSFWSGSNQYYLSKTAAVAKNVSFLLPEVRQEGKYFGLYDGTSFSAPAIANIIMLLISEYGMTATQARDIVIANSIPISNMPTLNRFWYDKQLGLWDPNNSQRIFLHTNETITNKPSIIITDEVFYMEIYLPLIMQQE